MFGSCLRETSLLQICFVGQAGADYRDLKSKHFGLKYPVDIIQSLRSAPAPVARWLAHQTAGWKVLGLNPVRVMAGSYPELGVLWAQWEGRNHSAELHPLHGYIFESVALIT